MHPVTGDLWGIEALLSQATVLYRIDATSGEADSILKVGSPEYGYDALHILDDGTFVATRGGPNVPADSVLWEIDTTPDSLGVVAIAPIPLTFDTLIVGDLNGLEAFPSSPPDTITLTLTADTTELHPWIPEWVQQADNGTIDQDLRVGDTTTVSLTVSLSGGPAADQPITFTAAFLDRTGGHHHLDDRLLFSDAPSVPQGAASGRPVTGYFKQGDSRVAELVDTTGTSGEVSFAFVAGFVAGDVEVIATTEYGGNIFSDRLAFRVRVPGLQDLEATTVVDDYAYLIGQFPYPPISPSDTTHARDSIWYVEPTFGDLLESLARSMVVDSAGTDYHLQINDASLPFGGTFSVFPDTTATTQLMDRPYDRGHRRSHVSGVDVDIAWCQVPVIGEDGQANRIQGTNCHEQEVAGVSYQRLITVANRLGLIVLTETNPYHFHLRRPEA